MDGVRDLFVVLLVLLGVNSPSEAAVNVHPYKARRSYLARSPGVRFAKSTELAAGINIYART